MVEPQPGLESALHPERFSIDAWLGGRLALVQPRNGHRVGSDAALLAAAAGAIEGRIVDAGAGVGAVGLALVRQCERARADLVEINPDLARLAAGNAARNGLAARARTLQVDVGDAGARREAGLVDEAADCVVTNPPFFDPRTVRLSPDEAKAQAHVFSSREEGRAPLAGWVRACLALLAPGGRFVMIHRPETLAQILEAADRRMGGLALLPIYPRAGAAAHRPG